MPIDHLSWPIIPGNNIAAVSALLYQMEHSEVYKSKELFQLQSRQLGKLFKHAVETVPFYNKRFKDAGIDGQEEVTLEALRRLPPLTRVEYQSASDTERKSTAIPVSHGKPSIIKTSGTTGSPVSLYKTPLMGLYWSACYLRNILWQKFDVGKKLAVIRYMEKPIGMPPNGTAGDTWNPILTQMFPDCGPAVGLNIASSLECQADWLMHHNPAYLLSYPSNLSALADIFEERGLKLPKLRRISTVSEVLSPEMRLKFNRVWNVPTSDIYTCEEVGYLAIQCPEYDHYHVQSANVFLEVVDLDGNPCPLGVEGRVLITSLHNFATPLIRYEVGDYAVQGGTCPCGRGSPVLKRILGRSRNRLILPDGTTEFPYFGGYDDWIAVHNGVAKQFQYVQRADGIIEKKMVMNGKLTPEQEEKSKQLILRSLGHPFEVVLTYHDNLPRSARGKFEEFVCAVQR